VENGSLRVLMSAGWSRAPGTHRQPGVFQVERLEGSLLLFAQARASLAWALFSHMNIEEVLGNPALEVV
jgi:hypothetical protein